MRRACLLFTIVLVLAGCSTWDYRTAVEPPGYAQAGPNPLEGDHYGHEQNENGMVERLKEPAPLEEENPILRCSENIVYVEAVEMYREILPNGLLSRIIKATTDTGQEQWIAAMYPITAVDMDGKNGVPDVHVTDWPLFYQVDLDGDKKADATFVDKGGEGICTDIVPYDPKEKQA